MTKERPNPETPFETVAKLGDIPEGEARAFEVGEKVIAVFFVDGEYTAIDDMCPHMGASLATGHVDCLSKTVACPWHAWRFSFQDGAWADNPRLKTDVFPVRIVGDEIQVSCSPIKPTIDPTK